MDDELNREVETQVSNQSAAPEIQLPALSHELLSE